MYEENLERDAQQGHHYIAHLGTNELWIHYTYLPQKYILKLL